MSSLKCIASITTKNIGFVFMFYFNSHIFSEGAMWISGNPTTKSACEMENHFFEKSKNKVLHRFFCQLYNLIDEP